MPLALVRAQMIDGLCQRWHMSPPELLEADAHELMQMMAILGAVKSETSS